MEISFRQVVPILRIFDIAKADEFYLGFLGFSVDWDHRFDAGAPLTARSLRAVTSILHLSEHHGDGCPGARLSGDDVGRLRLSNARSARRATGTCGRVSRRPPGRRSRPA